MRLLVLFGALCALAACEKETSTPSSADTTENTPSASIATPEPLVAKPKSLSTILETQSDETKARYQYRNPAKTIEFFGLKPGMTVAEYLPGGGWYSQILAPMLGSEGTLIGIDYSMDIWPNFSWMNDEFLAGRVAWPGEWTSKFAQWGGAEAAKPVATRVSELDTRYNGQVDAVLYIRAMHNLARFEDKGQFLSKSLSSTYSLLKPGGIVGIVQHEARENKSDEWATGARGYLKKSFVIKALTDAGFEFVAESSVNQNELDQPGDEDRVWRLPPSYSGSKDDEAKKAKVTAIGESNRMTLLFKKPMA